MSGESLEMRKIEAIGDSKQLFRLIKETGIENPAVSGTLRKRWDCYSFQSRRLKLLVGHFGKQSN